MNLGPVELLVLMVFAVVIVGFGVCIWAVVDALNATDAQWAAIGQNKILWVALIAGGTFLAGPVGFVLALVYLISMRPKLRSAWSAAPRYVPPGFTPPG